MVVRDVYRQVRQIYNRSLGSMGIASASVFANLLIGPHHASAAHVTGACCADLEQRISELEALQARTRSAALELTISGTINRAVLFWNDGDGRNAAVVTNDNDNSSMTIEGETNSEVSGWSVGFVIDLDIINAGSSDVNQRRPEPGTQIEPGDISWWVRNEALGQLSLGLTSAKGSSGGANEADLSGTEVASYVGVTDIGGGFFVRRSDLRGANGLLDVTWYDLIGSLDEPDGTIIAYDSPEVAGWSFSALWGEDDVWNLGLGFTTAHAGPFEVAAALAYNENLQGEVEGLPDHATVAGSVSVLHSSTGLNISLAGGQRRAIQASDDNSGTFGTSDSSSFGYLKLGWRAEIFAAGKTAFYAEHGRYRDFLGRDTDARIVGPRDDGPGARGLTTLCVGAPTVCEVSGSVAAVTGAGIVQNIEAVGAQLYLGARHHEAEIGVVDAHGSKVRAAPLSGFDTFIGGLLIEF